MSNVIVVGIARQRSEKARQILERIGWRGYIPPAVEHEVETTNGTEINWHLPVDQISLIRTVLRRNRRLAGRTLDEWRSIDQVCETIAVESARQGRRPDYRSGA